MGSQHSSRLGCSRNLLFALTFMILATLGNALAISYCSPDNNANYNGGSSIYMSNGKCQDACKANYAFAVIQGDNCYCSNYIPPDQVNTYSCNQVCPGFPTEWCGSTDQGLYAYFALGISPSGTSGGGGSSSAPATSSSSSGNPPTPTPLPTTSSTPTQVYTSVISVTGKVSTIIVTPTASPSPTSDSALGQAHASGGGGGMSPGQVAGIVVGVALGLGLLIGLAVFFWLRRRHRRNIDAISEGGSYTSPSAGSKNGGVPSRQVSQLSSAGLLGKIPRINTGGLSFGDEIRSVGQSNTNTDRNSTHMTVDQRLNPWAIYSNEDSRASNVSLQDNQDYSRQLRVANPDL